MKTFTQTLLQWASLPKSWRVFTGTRWRMLWSKWSIDSKCDSLGIKKMTFLCFLFVFSDFLFGVHCLPVNFYAFAISVITTRLISTKFGTKNYWLKGCLNLLNWMIMQNKMAIYILVQFWDFIPSNINICVYLWVKKCNSGEQCSPWSSFSVISQGRI